MASTDAVLVSPTPRLPRELERTIFEIVSLSWPRSILRLMLVAWRVKSWVEPFLYRTIIVSSRLNGGLAKKTSKTLLSRINSKQTTFRDSVRHLYLAHAVPDEAAGILFACSAVEHLWVAARTPIVLSDFNLALKRLHATLDVIFSVSQIDFSHRIFSSLTHLELFDAPVHIDLKIWSALTRLPHLTHFACNSEHYLPMCLAFLPTWKSLRVLVILLGEWAEMAAELLEDNFFELTHDPRFVIMNFVDRLKDWVNEVHAGGGFWLRAESHIAKRRPEQVNSRGCFVPNIQSEDDISSKFPALCFRASS